MFKQNKYHNWYYNIIERAKSRTIFGYTERHHIIPKSLGGSNNADNIVSLTAREHFICHLLLIKIVDDAVKHKMVYAAWQQSRPSKNKEVKVTGRIYEMLRHQLSESYTGQKRAPFNVEWRQKMSARAQGEKNNMFGKNHTEESIALMRKNRKGLTAGANNPFFGKTHSEEFRKRKAEHNKSRPKVFCPYCQRYFDVGMANRWHLDKCKFKPQEHTGDSISQH